MKKLYQGKGRRVHPAPPPAPDAALALLPAALLTLAAALTAEEQEVLAYLLSGIGTGAAGAGGGPAGRRSTTKRHNGPHQPEMGCGCFGCYKSFWARWDASPNRHLIHRIIDAVEEGSGSGPAGAPTRRGGHRRRRRGRGGRDLDLDASAASDATETDAGTVFLQQVCCASDGGDDDGDYEGDEDDGADSVFDHDGEEAIMTDDSDCSTNAGISAEKSTVGKLVRFIGEKVWGPWT